MESGKKISIGRVSIGPESLISITAAAVAAFFAYQVSWQNKINEFDDQIDAVTKVLEWHAPERILEFSSYRDNESQGLIYESFMYAKSLDGFVHFTGLMEGCQSNTREIFTLPKEYRPQFAKFLHGMSGHGAAEILVDPDGRVFFWRLAKIPIDRTTDEEKKATTKCNNPRTSSDWLSISGLSFFAGEGRIE